MSGAVAKPFHCVGNVHGVPCRLSTGRDRCRGRRTQQKLFYSVGIERLVAQDHPVRRLKEVLDLRFFWNDTREFCSHEGKPSIDPVVLLKLYLLGYCFAIPSERRLFREVQVNLAYRWYLGYDLDEPIPDHSIMTKSRYQFPSEVFERLFKQIVRLSKEKGLISGDYYFLDSLASASQ